MTITSISELELKQIKEQAHITFVEDMIKFHKECGCPYCIIDVKKFEDEYEIIKYRKIPGFLD